MSGTLLSQPRALSTAPLRAVDDAWATFVLEVEGERSSIEAAPRGGHVLSCPAAAFGTLIAHSCLNHPLYEES